MRVPPYQCPISVDSSRIRIKRDANLDIGLGLISDLHNEFSVSVNHVLEDLLIDTDREDRVKAVPASDITSHLHCAKVV